MTNLDPQTVILIALSVGVALSLYLHLQRIRKDRQRMALMSEFKHSVAHVTNDLNGLCSGSVGIGKRINRLEKRIKSQDLRQNKLENSEPSLHIYGQAMALVHKGAKVDEVVSYCGLSRGEAELLMFVNSEKAKTSHH